MARVAVALLLALATSSCNGDQAVDATVPPPDMTADGPLDGADAAPPTDMAAVDRGPADTTPPDRGPTDADPIDVAAPDAAPDMGPPPPYCVSGYARAEVSGNLVGDLLAEASGLAFSATRPNVLWTHTDSGGDPDLYAVDTAGNLRGTHRLPVENVDWEDIAAAACPDGSGPCLWVADVGDNLRQRDDAAVLAVPEPLVLGGEAAQVWRFPVSYPGGPMDVEALAVAPDGSAFWLFEKLDGPVARVFGSPGPLVDGEAIALEEVTRISSPGLAIENGRSITAADLHPDGTRLVLRVYTGSYEYIFAEGAGPAAGMAALSTIDYRTVSLGPLDEPQGEAITYGPDGREVWTVSEDPERLGGQPLHRYRCRD